MITDIEIIIREKYTHGTQTYELKKIEGGHVYLYNEAEKWGHWERIKYFKQFYNKA